jgi:hypothetical protein
VPRITSVPGFPSSASVVSLAIVLGFSILIPFLAIVVTYAAVPAGARNSLIFNGSTVGSASLLFFVMVSFGSGGVMKCAPYNGYGTNLSFIALVFTYWVLLYLIELAVFFRFNPLGVFWNILAGRDAQTGDSSYTTSNTAVHDGFLNSVSINYWRIPGCVLNLSIVLSTMWFCTFSVHTSVIIAVIVVLAAHLPLVFSIDFDWLLLSNDGPAPGSPAVVEGGEMLFKNGGDGSLYQTVPSDHQPVSVPTWQGGQQVTPGANQNIFPPQTFGDRPVSSSLMNHFTLDPITMTSGRMHHLQQPRQRRA